MCLPVTFSNLIVQEHGDLSNGKLCDHSHHLYSHYFNLPKSPPHVQDKYMPSPAKETENEHTLSLPSH